MFGWNRTIVVWRMWKGKNVGMGKLNLGMTMQKCNGLPVDCLAEISSSDFEAALEMMDESFIGKLPHAISKTS